MKQLSHFFSFIFSPLLVPTYSVAMALWFSILTYAPLGVKWRVIAIVFLITAVFPAVCIALLKAFGLVTDIGLNNRNERSLPYCIVCLSYLGTAFYFYSIHMPGWMIMFMVGATAAVLLSMLVNMWWKISAHLAGMGGAVGMLMRIILDNDSINATFPMLLTMIVLTGIVGTARVDLNRHTLGQVIAGALNGVLCTLIATAF